MWTGSERKGKAVSKGRIIEKLPLWATAAQSPGSSGNSRGHVLWSFCARRREKGAGVFIHQLRLVTGSGLLLRYFWPDAQVDRAGSGSLSLRKQILAGEADPLQGSEGVWVRYQLPAVWWKPAKLQPRGLSAAWQTGTRTASPGTCAAGAYNSETAHSLRIISAQSLPHKHLFQINAAE